MQEHATHLLVDADQRAGWHAQHQHSGPILRQPARRVCVQLHGVWERRHCFLGGGDAVAPRPPNARACALERPHLLLGAQGAQIYERSIAIGAAF